MKKKTQKEFIEEVKRKHGNKYILDKCVYKGYLKNVTVTCPKHGDFSIRADHLLGGSGCHECTREITSKKRMLSTEEFVSKAKKVHGNKYDYSRTVYNGLSKRLIVTCPIHGDFEQRASNHLEGCGCPKCGKEDSLSKRSLNFEYFKQRANDVHKGKYKYIEESFKNGKSKIKIICPVHGEFIQQANAHLLGQGCPKCGRDKSTKIISEPKQQIDFINEANEKHKRFYDYSEVVYKNNYTNVSIICPIHGKFLQTPKNHLRGSGCPKCSRSTLEESVANVLDEMKIKYIHRASKRDLKWLGYQHLDFYLVDYSIAIECQGIQHFKPIDFAGKGEMWAINRFNKQKKLDEKKREKCLKNNIELVCINFNDNVVECLNKIIGIFGEKINKN